MRHFILKAAGALLFASFASSASSADNVNVRFSWKLKTEYAHFYLGLDKGLYRDEGINPVFGEGAGAQAAIGSIIQGQEDIAVIPGVLAITAIQKGAPIKIIALYQPVLPLIVLSQSDAPVTKPKEMEGKSIATCPGDAAGDYLAAFCSRNAIDCGKIKVARMDCGARLAQFIEKRVDMISTYLNTDIPIFLERLGRTYPYITMADYGMKVPGLALVASDQAIASKAGVLKRFLKATNAALKELKVDPQAAATAMKSAWSLGPSDAVILRQVHETLKTFKVPESKPAGWVDVSNIEDALSLLGTGQGLGTPKKPEAYFTNELL